MKESRSRIGRTSGLVIIGLVIALAGVAMLFSVPKVRGASMAVGEFLYEPLDLQLNVGDRMNLDVKNSYKNLYFGMMIEEYDFYEVVPPGEEKTLTLPLDKAGEFPIQYALGETPELLFKFGTGKLLVEQNYLYVGGATSTLAVAVGLPFYLSRKKKASSEASNPGFSFDLLRIGMIKRMLKSRAFQYALIVPNLFIFIIIILAGLFGTPFFPRNFSTVIIWTLWLFILVVILMPFFQRFWCTMCPIPAYGEWLQRRAFIKKSNKPLTLGKKWPTKLRNLWLGNFTLLSVALFSEVITIRPLATGYLVLIFVVAGILFFLIFSRRTYCRYVCPLGSFASIYGMFSSLELGVKDSEICRECGVKLKQRCPAFDGTEEGYGCPWFEYPATMYYNGKSGTEVKDMAHVWSTIYHGHIHFSARSNNCGLCMECIKTCPEDAIALRVRPFGKDLLIGRKQSLDEPFAILILLAVGILHVSTSVGPWGWLREWGRWMGSTGEFTAYFAIFLAITLLIVPGAFLASSRLSRFFSGVRGMPAKNFFTNYSYALIPLGLTVWIAFMVRVMLTYGTYILWVISDPFGWGWNLFGTANVAYSPFFPEAIPYLQALIALIGLALTIYFANRISRQILKDEKEAWGSFVAVIVFASLITLFLVRIYL